MTDVATSSDQGRAKNWYIVHTYSGFENKVKESLEQRVQAYGLQNEIELLWNTGELRLAKPASEVCPAEAPKARRRTTGCDELLEVGHSDERDRAS